MKKTKSRETIFEKCHVTEKHSIAAFSYNLDTACSGGKRDGAVIVDKTDCRIYEDGKEIRVIPLCEIKNLTYRPGVGCVTVEYRTVSGEDRLLARATFSCKNGITAAVKKINYYIKNGEKFPEEKNGNAYPEKYSRNIKGTLRSMKERKVLSRLLSVVKPYTPYMVIPILLFCCITAISLIVPMLNQHLTDDYILRETPPLFSAFLLVIAEILGVQILQNLLRSLRWKVSSVAENHVADDLRNQVFEKIQRLSVARISKRTAGELMRRVSSDTQQIKNVLMDGLSQFIEQLLVFVSVGILMFAYDYRLALFILIPMPFVGLFFLLFRTTMRKLFRKNWERASESGTVLHDIFQGIRVVKSYGMEKSETERFGRYAEAEKKSQLAIERKWAYINPILQFCLSFGQFFILFYAGNAILGGQMTLGEMSKFSSYAGMMYGPLEYMSGFPRRLMMAMASVVKVFEILDEPEDIKEAEKPIALDVKGQIDFDNVSFGYDEAVDVLRDINLHIKPGEFIGLVGKSGTGKSTLINLVMRMYDVEEGTLSIDGVNIKEISGDSLRSQIGVVLQETFLFNGSIFQNIAYAKPDATREEVIAAAKTSGAHSFIVKLTDGYDTKVGEKGCTLSGGEKQRIAIARALLHNPKILILDEATASLDTETEKQIQDSLATLVGSRTTIAIAHRLSTLRNATRLVVLDHGRIAEVGSHDELMERKGIYYGLVMAQREMSKME